MTSVSSPIGNSGNSGSGGSSGGGGEGMAAVAGTRRMHPAPSLAEAPPRPDESHSGQPMPMSPGEPSVHTHQSHSNSPPMRKDTNSSTSTNATHASLSTMTTGEKTSTPYSIDSSRPGEPSGHVHKSHSNSPPTRKNTNSSTSTNATHVSETTMTPGEKTSTPYSIGSSPTYSSQPIFSINDASDMASRRANRRRTGPLSAEQRHKAAIIRKLGACDDCRRRRVACTPAHYNMTWDEAMIAYRAHSPNRQELAPIATADRPINPGPAPIHTRTPSYTNDHQDIMDLDQSPTSVQPGRPPLSETRIRTPLPSAAPRLERTAQAVIALPGIDSPPKPDLHETVSRILSTTHRTRYSAVHVLFVMWPEAEHAEVRQAVDELRSVLEVHYNYTFEVGHIPKHCNEGNSPCRWLLQRTIDFVNKSDQRDVLKIVYYNGYTYLDENRNMVLSPSRHADDNCTIRWAGVQKILEDASADTLVLMDAAFYASDNMVRQRGMLEIIAAGASEDHIHALGRCTFTKAVTELLRNRACQVYMSPFSAAGLHARLLSEYPRIVKDLAPAREIVTSFPAPFHLQLSGSNRLPSILLAPLRRDRDLSSRGLESPVCLNLSLGLTDDALNMDSWTEWFRSMPEGIQDVKVIGPYR